MTICVYGAASSSIDKIYTEQTELLGETIAKRGFSLVFGGGGNGVMGACARGAHRNGGKIIGIVPSFFNVDGVIFDGCTELIYTETMRERKKTMEELSEAFIVAPGGIGTFDEFFEIFTLQNLGRHTKPIAIFNVNSYYDPMLQMLQCQVNEGFISTKALERLIISDDPCEILDKIASYIHIS
ncbi:MAG: TIGR00730 family Rossman fold protein [Clostridia bacterium]|nr:TIGR00730 family Rossman fold protein [Clostridia bacterium]